MRDVALDRGGCTPSIKATDRPIRLQRPRRRGTPLPPGAIYVGRPTLFANPFDGQRFGHARSVRLFARWINGKMGDLTLEMLGYCPAEIEALHRLRSRILHAIPRLAGQHLQCWCPSTSRWCHADILLEIANG